MIELPPNLQKDQKDLETSKITKNTFKTTKITK